MKNLWNSNLQSTLLSGALQIKQSWGNSEQQQQQQPQTSSPAAPGGEKQYLRLPLESARKLRWYDKADLQALVKNHLRDKRDLMDTITALKKLLIRSGITDSQLDEETRQLLIDVEIMREADGGVNSVLLASAEGELENLRDKVDQLEQELVAAKSKPGVVPHFSIGSEDSANDPLRLLAAPAVDPALVAGLVAALEKLEQCNNASMMLSRQLLRQEQEIAVRETEDAMRALMASAAADDQRRHQRGEGGSGSDDAENGADAAAGSSDDEEGTSHEADRLRQTLQSEREQRLAMVGKLQRLETERRAATDELDALSDEVRTLRGAAQEASELRAALAAASARGAATEAAYESTTDQLVSLKAQLKEAQELAEKRLAEVRKYQASGQGQDALRKYQDICLEAEERAAHAERRAGLADARCAKLEVAVREAQQEAKGSTKASLTLQKELEAALAKLAAAEAAASNHAARSAHENKTAAETAASAKLLEAARLNEEELKLLQRETAALKSQLAGAEARWQAAEAREARLMAEQHELEAADAEREELSAQVLALRARLAEHRAEKEQVEHYKLVASQQELARARVEQELVLTARVVTEMEGRLREMLAKVDMAETQAAIAESRARAAENTISAEVEMRMSTACSNRTTWPEHIRDEFSRLEADLGSTTAGLVTARSQLATECSLHQAEAKQKAELQRHISVLDERLQRLEHEGSTRLKEVEVALGHAQHTADNYREALNKLEKEHEQVLRNGPPGMARSPSISGQLFRPSFSGGSLPTMGSNGSGGGGSGEQGKWQVQNSVGGGSLYGVADGVRPGTTGAAPSNSAITRRPSIKLSSSSDQVSVTGGSPAAGSGGKEGVSAATVAPGGGGKIEQTDLVYLKNVLLKFLEAHATNRVAERDVLLPAVATLLQATPQEFKVLRKLMTNTAPPTMQMLSALGWKA